MRLTNLLESNQPHGEKPLGTAGSIAYSSVVGTGRNILQSHLSF